MPVVREDLMMMGSQAPLRSLERDEHQLLSPPHPNRMPIKLWQDHAPLPIVHFSQQYQAAGFAPPRGVYENDHIRVEWQMIEGRQPFYHRNCDVDEISYQIAGERTLMTELGVVEHRPGEFSRIPRGVAHDNYSRRESHLLFYIPAPVDELVDGIRTSEEIIPPFPGWQPAPVNEAITECMGTVGHDIAVFGTDEKLLLGQVYRNDKDRLQVLRSNAAGLTWLYATKSARLGIMRHTTGAGGDHYRRTLDADEIQYQITGERFVLTQRGIAEVGPGDFIRIPLGLAHADFCTGPAEYLVLQSDRELPQIADSARAAHRYTPELLTQLRSA